MLTASARGRLRPHVLTGWLILRRLLPSNVPMSCDPGLFLGVRPLQDDS